MAVLILGGCGGLHIRPHEETVLSSLEDIPREVLAECPDFSRLIKACHPNERMWWVIYETGGSDGVRARSVGLRRVGRGWKRTINSNRPENYCE